ncbi:MAG: adenine phosphoribosyltransferase [Pseudomonadota bacterium]
MTRAMDLKSKIRTIPDYPKPGIMFRDVSTLMGDAQAFREAIKALATPFEDAQIAKVAGIDARGFILGGAMAVRLGAGFLPLRKPGKLPFDTFSETYDHEYGTDSLHMHVDGVDAGERVLLVDDLIATGGTAEAGLKLLRHGGADVVAASFLVDLPDLGGAARLRGHGVNVHALLAFEGH